MQPSSSSHLDFETSAPSPTTGLLEFPPLRLDIRLLVLVRPHPEMLDRFSGVLGSSEENNVRAGRVLHSQLIDSHAAAASLLDASARCGREAQGGDVECGNGEETVVVCDGGDNADGLVGVGFLGGFGGDFAGDAGDGHRGAVDAGHEEAAEDDFVEV
jgi:hypothetical protein